MSSTIIIIIISTLSFVKEATGAMNRLQEGGKMSSISMNRHYAASPLQVTCMMQFGSS